MLIKKRPPVEPVWLAWQVPESLNVKAETHNTPAWVVAALLRKQIIPVVMDGRLRGVDVSGAPGETDFHACAGDFLLLKYNFGNDTSTIDWVSLCKFWGEYEVVSEGCHVAEAGVQTEYPLKVDVRDLQVNRPGRL